MFAVLYTNGQIHFDEVRYECCPEKWVPLFVYTLDGVRNIPLFKSQEIAKAFSKRNFPKNWMQGGVCLTSREIQWIKDKGIKINEMSYPNKLKDIKNIEFGMEIVEFEVEPDFGVA